MKHRSSPAPRKKLRTACIPVVAFVSTLLALPVSAATTFPDYPLQTGVGSIPPNIMFILDNSGSMGLISMPTTDEKFGAEPEDYTGTGTGGTQVGLNDNPHDRSYVNNAVYYNPYVTYRPWLTQDGVTRQTGGTSVDAVYTSWNLASGGTRDLRNDKESIFYVPVSSDVAPSSNPDPSDYVRYRIRHSDGKVEVVRIAKGAAWNSGVAETPTGRSQEDELRNIATWYSYYRSRMKTAKAAATEAFGTLGENFRVGYTPINRSGSDPHPTGTNPLIPVNKDDGLFKGGNGSNKEDWFKKIRDAETAPGATPLRTALDTVGQYFKRTDSNGPWGPKSGSDQLSCRQNFAILTTDGYWNDSTSATFGLDDEDKDGHKVTLADIAYNYYKNDLRSGLADNVPRSSIDSPNWQHLVTFGISIGLRGSLVPTESGHPRDADIWPNPMDREDAHRIDDLWHATVNTRGKFVVASNPEELSAGLKAALANIAGRQSSGSNVTSNGPQLNAGSRIFQATFHSGDWSGDVASISIGTGSIADSSSWSMAAVANDNPEAFLARGVYTWDVAGSDGATFPTATQLNGLGRDGGIAPVGAAANAAYLKGDRSREQVNGGTLRSRSSPIGDIVNSSPFYSEEAAALFIGANDGMLHGVNAATGVVEFSYVPAGIDPARMATLSSPEYAHRFFVDGGVEVTTRAQGGDRNLLVGSLGRGGKGVFALDVTDPATFDATKVLWDRSFNDATGSGDGDMGHVLGEPLVRKAHNGATVAFVGNGVDSANGSAALFVYDAVTGAQVRKFVVDVGPGNGLAPPRAADTNGDGIADYLYAGDLKGNLWKFDIRDKNASKWTAGKFFTAVGPDGVQPITSAVAIAREPATDRIFILLGTGRYLSVGDIDSDEIQSVYGLIDSGSAIAGRNELQQRTIAQLGVDSKGRTARSFERYSPLPDGKKGWYLDLDKPTPGERVVSAPFMRGQELWFSSIIPLPGTGCDAGGSGYLNGINAFTGTNPQVGSGTGSPIDVDGDGEGNDQLAGGDGTNAEDRYVSSVDLGIGMVGRGVAVGSGIYACGSEAACGMVGVPTDGTGARRLGWRELYDRN